MHANSYNSLAILDWFQEEMLVGRWDSSVTLLVGHLNASI
jgi:hypothetical protein